MDRKPKSTIYIAHECDGGRFILGLREELIDEMGDPCVYRNWDALSDYLEHHIINYRPELADVWEFNIPSLLDHLFECAQMDDSQVCMSPEWYLELFVNLSYEFDVPADDDQRDYVFGKMAEMYRKGQS